MTAQKLIKKFNDLKSERGNFESLWQDVSHYCDPRKAIINTTRTIGSELTTELYDSVGRRSSQIFAAGLHAYLTNPSSKWFTLAIKNQELNENPDIKEWLKKCEDRIYDAINGSNFSQQIFEIYKDLGVFGTATLYEEEDIETIIRFYARPINEIIITENEREEVDEVFRYFQFTVKQAYAIFGKDAGETVEKNLKDKPNEKIDFLHWVGKRDERTAGKDDSKNKPYASKWIEFKHQHLCREGGYDEFPFFVVRFNKNSTEKYGYSPAINVLPELRMVNKMKKTILKQSEKMVNQPMDAPDEGYTLPLDMSAGAVNYHRLGLGDADKIRPLLPDVSRALPITQDMILGTRDEVKAAFFVDLFLMLTTQPKMTATEVMQRVNEKMLILSPVLGRLMSELLRRIINRTFNILFRRGRLPQPPQALEGQDYIIEYISPLARAQKSYESQSLQQFIGVVQEIAQAMPESLDVVKSDEAIREYAQIQNISPKILRSDSEVQEIRQERQKQIEAQQQLAMAQQGADVAQKVGKAQQKGGL